MGQKSKCLQTSSELKRGEGAKSLSSANRAKDLRETLSLAEAPKIVATKRFCEGPRSRPNRKSQGASEKTMSRAKEQQHKRQQQQQFVRNRDGDIEHQNRSHQKFEQHFRLIATDHHHSPRASAHSSSANTCLNRRTAAFPNENNNNGSLACSTLHSNGRQSVTERARRPRRRKSWKDSDCARNREQVQAGELLSVEKKAERLVDTVTNSTQMLAAPLNYSFEATIYRQQKEPTTTIAAATATYTATAARAAAIHQLPSERPKFGRGGSGRVRQRADYQLQNKFSGFYLHARRQSKHCLTNFKSSLDSGNHFSPKHFNCRAGRDSILEPRSVRFNRFTPRGDNMSNWRRQSQQANNFKRDRRPLQGEWGLLAGASGSSSLAAASGTTQSSSASPRAATSQDKQMAQRQRPDDSQHNRTGAPPVRVGAELTKRPESTSFPDKSSKQFHCDYFDSGQHINSGFRSKNLHPLEIYDQRARMSISIYDPLSTSSNQTQQVYPNPRTRAPHPAPRNYQSDSNSTLLSKENRPPNEINKPYKFNTNRHCTTSQESQFAPSNNYPSNFRHQSGSNFRHHRDKGSPQNNEYNKRFNHNINAKPGRTIMTMNNSPNQLSNTADILDDDLESFTRELRQPIFQPDEFPAARNEVLKIRIESQRKNLDGTLINEANRPSKIVEVSFNWSEEFTIEALRRELISLNFDDSGRCSTNDDERIYFDEARQIANICQNHFQSSRFVRNLEEPSAEARRPASSENSIKIAQPEERPQHDTTADEQKGVQGFGGRLQDEKLEISSTWRQDKRVSLNEDVGRENCGNNVDSSSTSCGGCQLKSMEANNFNGVNSQRSTTPLEAECTSCCCSCCCCFRRRRRRQQQEQQQRHQHQYCIQAPTDPVVGIGGESEDSKGETPRFESLNSTLLSNSTQALSSTSMDVNLSCIEIDPLEGEQRCELERVATLDDDGELGGGAGRGAGECGEDTLLLENFLEPSERVEESSGAYNGARPMQQEGLAEAIALSGERNRSDLTQNQAGETSESRAKQDVGTGVSSVYSSGDSIQKSGKRKKSKRKGAKAGISRQQQQAQCGDGQPSLQDQKQFFPEGTVETRQGIELNQDEKQDLIEMPQAVQVVETPQQVEGDKENGFLQISGQLNRDASRGIVKQPSDILQECNGTVKSGKENPAKQSVSDLNPTGQSIGPAGVEPIETKENLIAGELGEQKPAPSPEGFQCGSIRNGCAGTKPGAKVALDRKVSDCLDTLYCTTNDDKQLGAANSNGDNHNEPLEVAALQSKQRTISSNGGSHESEPNRGWSKRLGPQAAPVSQSPKVAGERASDSRGNEWPASPSADWEPRAEPANGCCVIQIPTGSGATESAQASELQPRLDLLGRATGKTQATSESGSGGAPAGDNKCDRRFACKSATQTTQVSGDKSPLGNSSDKSYQRDEKLRLAQQHQGEQNESQEPACESSGLKEVSVSISAGKQRRKIQQKPGQRQPESRTQAQVARLESGCNDKLDREAKSDEHNCCNRANETDFVEVCKEDGGEEKKATDDEDFNSKSTCNVELDEKEKRFREEENSIEIVKSITDWQTTAAAAATATTSEGTSLSLISKSQAPSLSKERQQQRQQQQKLASAELKQQQVNSSNSYSNNENNNNKSNLNRNNNNFNSKEQRNSSCCISRSSSSSISSGGDIGSCNTDRNTASKTDTDNNNNKNKTKTKTNSKSKDSFAATEVGAAVKIKSNAQSKAISPPAAASSLSSLLTDKRQQERQPTSKQQTQRQKKSSLPSPPSFALVVANQSQSQNKHQHPEQNKNNSNPNSPHDINNSTSSDREPSSNISASDFDKSDLGKSQSSGMAHQQQQSPSQETHSPTNVKAKTATTINNNSIQLQRDSKPILNNNIIEQPEHETDSTDTMIGDSSRPEAIDTSNSKQPETTTIDQDAESSEKTSLATRTTATETLQRVPSQPQEQSANTPVTPAPTSQQPPANNRSILILREIEPNSSSEAVKELFNSENCPSKPVHCEYALHNSWYVTFKNDEDAKQALTFIRKYIITWNGQPIMARYKPKPAVPSASNQPPPNMMPQHMVMQQQQLATSDHLNHNNAALTTLQQVPPQTSSSETITTTASNSASLTAMNDTFNTAAAAVSMGSPSRSIGGQTSNIDSTNVTATPAVASNGLLLYQQAPNHGMMHPSTAHHLNPAANPQMLHTHHQHHEPQPMHHSGYGYSAVAYYGQHGPILTPYHLYPNGPQYELSEVFIYNGLTPYPQSIKSSASGNDKAFIGGGGVSSAALLGGEMPYHHPHHLQQPHPHHHHHQVHHQHHPTGAMTMGMRQTTLGGAVNGSKPYGHQRSHKANSNHNNLDYGKHMFPVGSSNGLPGGNISHHQHHHGQQQHHSNQNQSTSSNYSSSSGTSSASQTNSMNKCNNNNLSAKRTRNSGSNRNNNGKQNVM